MRAFFRLVQQARRPGMHAPRFEERIGAETLRALLREGIVVRGHPATWWPCEGPENSGCPRRVRRSAAGEGPAFVAFCGASPPRCLAVRLGPDDLEMLSTSLPALAQLLRRLLEVDATAIEGASAFGDVILLGTVGPPHQLREAFFTPDPLSPSFVPFLLARRAARLGTLALVPSTWRVPQRLIEQHGAVDRVEVQYLERLLEVRDGRIQLASTARGRATTAPVSAAEFCLLQDRAGTRRIDEATYGGITTAVTDYDLVLDLVAIADSGGHRAYCRRGDGVLEVDLTRNEATAVERLMEAGRPMTAVELVAPSVGRPVKVVERARKKLDVQRSRTSWTLIHTVAVGVHQTKAFLFQPPAGFRFAVLRPDTGQLHET